MRRLRLGLLFWLYLGGAALDRAALGGTVPGEEAPPERNTAQTRPLIACGHPIYPPVSWAEKGILVGVAPEVTRQLFEPLGYRLEFKVVGNWKRCLLEAGAGHVDLIVSAYRTQARQADFLFTEVPVVIDPIAVFFNHRRPLPLNRWVDLRGYTAGLLLGDSFGDTFDRFLDRHVRVERVSKGVQNLTKLALGRIDFMPIGLHSGRLQVQRLGYEDQIVPHRRILLTEQYHIAISRRSPASAHLPEINRHLKQLRDDGTLERLQHDYSWRYLEGD